MTANLPALVDPLVPPDCDLRPYPTMPLDVGRLRDSGISSHENAEVFRAAVLLWCASWHQVPASSLPTDDRELAKLAGFGRFAGEWLKIKEEAMHGFVLCSDGRFYHRVVAEMALVAWESRKRFIERSRRANIAKYGEGTGRPRSQLMKEAQARGTHTDAEWAAMLEVCGHSCVICGRKDRPLAKEHVRPISSEGSDAIGNLQPACSKCNAAKGTREEDHRPEGWENLLVETMERGISSLKDSLKDPSLGSQVNGTERNNEERKKTPAGSKKDAPPKAAPATRGTRLPTGWYVDADLRAYAVAQGFTDAEIDEIEESFCLWWPAQPGQKGVKTDWGLTFKTWVRQERNRHHGKSGTRPRPGGHSTDSLQNMHAGFMAASRKG